MGEHPSYQYVILDYKGGCWLVLDNAIERCAGLPSLMADGWRPVRETPFHNDSAVTPYVLILLDRDGKGDESGFGFA